MRHIALGAVLLLALAGCTSTGSSGSDAASAPAAASEDRSAFVGNWSGSLTSGDPITVSVPASGNPSYSYNGDRVPVRSARLSGGSLVLTVGSGGGTVTLTPQGKQLGLAYRFRGNSASGVLSRA